MKSKLFVPFAIVVFLAGSTSLAGQEGNEKKIERLQRKIEKQTNKLQELTGEEYQAYAQIAPPMDAEEIRKISEEAREQAQEAREQVRESMERQREAMEEQREAMEEQRKAFREQKRELERSMILSDEDAAKLKELQESKFECLEEMKDIEIDIRKDLGGNNFKYYYKSPNWKSGEGKAYYFSDKGDLKIDIPQIHGGVWSVYGDDRDVLRINKDLADETSAADFNYEVKKGTERLSVKVNGAIDAGKVRISIKKPDGELYNEYTLSPLANVDWNQTISFEEQEESEYLGKWTVTVAAEKAKGKYSVHLNGR